MTSSYNPFPSLNFFNWNKSSELPPLHLKSEPVTASEDLQETARKLIAAFNGRPEGKVNFTHDNSMKKNIDALFEADPRCFGYEKKYAWSQQEEIDLLVSHLKAHFKIETQDEALLKTQQKSETFPWQEKSKPIEEVEVLPENDISIPQVENLPLEEKEGELHEDVVQIEENADAMQTKSSPPVEEIKPIETDVVTPVALADSLLENNEGSNTKTQPEVKTTYKDYNLGLAYLQMQDKVFNFQEMRINKLLAKLAELNKINKDLSDFISALTIRKESGKADFSNDKEMQALIDQLYTMNPKMFGNVKTYVWKNEKEIDVLLAGLDAEVKAKVAEVNQVAMFINIRFDERVQGTESARKGIETDSRHKESIISKFNKN